jgi:hypothetical protein
VRAPASAAGAAEGELRRPLRVLLICNYDPEGAAAVSEHIAALVRHSEHEVFALSGIGEVPREFPLERFDAVVVHYSVFIAVDAYLGPRTRRRLRDFGGLKAVFLHDEYRFVSRTVAAIEDLGIGLVFTCVDPSEWPKVYPPELTGGAQLEQVLTGYVSDALTLYRPVPLRKRTIDVGYRGRVYPLWHGNAGREKSEIGLRFAADAERYGLTHDIALGEGDRLYGRAWVDFMQRCRAVLAVESGCSVFDFDGTLSLKVETVANLREDFTYDEARERYFAELEDRIDLYQISPRVFEAVALRTLLIMYEGRYSGVMEPWRHYIPLRKDHANMDEVAGALRDEGRCAEIIANAYAEVAMNPDYSFRKFVGRVDELLEQGSEQRRRESPAGLDLVALRKRYPLVLLDDPHRVPVGLVESARHPAVRLRRIAGGVRRRAAAWARRALT